MPSKHASDFEEVPQAVFDSHSDDDGEWDDLDDDDDSDMDIFGSLVAAKVTKPAVKAKAKPTANTALDFMEEGEGENDDEESFIAQEIQAANRKKKKSGGFQSMGEHRILSMP